MRTGVFVCSCGPNIGDRIDIQKIAETVGNWQIDTSSQSEDSKEESEQIKARYEDTAGFCKSASFDEIRKNDFILTPGRYVGLPEEEDDGEPFDEKMVRLTGELSELFTEGDILQEEVKKQLKKVGYEI